MTDDTDEIAAGWYPDSEGTIRWWDGGQWTEHIKKGSADTERTVVLPADRSTPARRPESSADDEHDHKRRTWLAATVVGLLAFFLGLGIGGAGSPEPEIPVAAENASSGATAQELDQKEAELEQRDDALSTKENELEQREQDIEQRESDLEENQADAATTITDGTVEVGRDVQPGQYLSPGPKDPDVSPCSYRVSSDKIGTEIITEEDSEGQAEAFLEPGQFFTSEGCQTWELQ